MLTGCQTVFAIHLFFGIFYLKISLCNFLAYPFCCVLLLCNIANSSGSLILEAASLGLIYFRACHHLFASLASAHMLFATVLLGSALWQGSSQVHRLMIVRHFIRLKIQMIFSQFEYWERTAPYHHPLPGWRIRKSRTHWFCKWVRSSFY